LILLKKAGAPEAALDAGARFPQPRCLPGTRETIQNQLHAWLLDLLRTRKMVWLYGPAGVGKSAVAQSFAEYAKNQKRLGAAFFFSSLDNPETRSDPLRVVPALAYQLAIQNKSYHHAVTQQLASDPTILDATLDVQFHRLIVEPFGLLASRQIQPLGKDSFVIVIDGLGECRSDYAQRMLVNLIKDAAQKSGVPLIWLICSRPERHLTSTFSRFEYINICDFKELTIDTEARRDTELYLRTRFQAIYNDYCGIMDVGVDSTWPSEADLQAVLKEVDGHFIVASVVEKFVGDTDATNPQAQLASLLNLIRGLKVASTGDPLKALDIFYSRILDKLSKDSLPIAMRVLALCTHGFGELNGRHPEARPRTLSTRHLWLFIQSNQAGFYSAMEKLHSVLNIPLAKHAPHRSPTFYHKSFADYLSSSQRSKDYHASLDHALQCKTVCSLYWYTLILRYLNPQRESPLVFISHHLLTCHHSKV
jgi:hypothetical protein